MQQELEAQKLEATKYRAIAEPGKELFKKGNHFSAAVDLSIVQVLCLGIARKKVPQLYGIFARLFNIKLPGREMKVRGKMVDGKPTFVKRFVYHTVPGRDALQGDGIGHVPDQRAASRQVAAMDYMNSDETSICYLADGAEAQQLEASSASWGGCCRGASTASCS